MGDKCSNPMCVDGWIVDPYKHKKVECEECKQRRKNEVVTGEARVNLNLPESFVNAKFIPESVFPSYVRSYMDENSVNEVCEAMQNLIDTVIRGELPSHSMLFNLGAKVIENNFLCPLVLRGYKAGLKCVPILDTFELCSMRNAYEMGLVDDSADNEDLNYNKVLNSDLCVVTIDAGSTYKGVMGAKGLMQLRSKRDKPTIFLTHLLSREVYSMCHEDAEIKSFYLATMYSVKYIKKVTNDYKESTILSKEEFEALKHPKNIL